MPGPKLLLITLFVYGALFFFGMAATAATVAAAPIWQPLTLAFVGCILGFFAYDITIEELL